jgi:hypothetical protein
MKKIVFWVSQIIVAPVFLAALLMNAFSDAIIKVCHWYEGWAFDYEAEGWMHIGDGVYKHEPITMDLSDVPIDEWMEEPTGSPKWNIAMDAYAQRQRDSKAFIVN